MNDQFVRGILVDEVYAWNFEPYNELEILVAVSPLINRACIIGLFFWLSFQTNFQHHFFGGIFRQSVHFNVLVLVILLPFLLFSFILILVGLDSILIYDYFATYHRVKVFNLLFQ